MAPPYIRAHEDGTVIEVTHEKPSSRDADDPPISEYNSHRSQVHYVVMRIEKITAKKVRWRLNRGIPVTINQISAFEKKLFEEGGVPIF